MGEQTIGAADDRSLGMILAVGLDDLTLGRIRALVRGTELYVEATDREGAVARARAATGPFIALLEWSEELHDQQTKVCAALRKAARAGGCHLVAVGGSSDPALARAVETATNDVLTRPFGVEVVPRLRHVLRSLRATLPARTVHDTLDEALRSPHGGEVAVRSGDAVGRIHVQNGLIVWANLSSAPATMEDVVRHIDVALDPEVAAAVKEECRTRKAHFMDVLVEWGVVDAERAKAAVRAFVEKRVQLILELPEATSVFLPKVRQQGEQNRFGIDEIPPTRRPTKRVPTPVRAFTPFPMPKGPALAVAEVFEAAKKIEGATSVAILDRRTGNTVLVSGQELEGTIAWSQVSLLAALGEGAEDVIGSTGNRCYVVRPIDQAPELALLVVFAQADTTIGLARVTVARVAAGSAPSSRTP